MIEKLLGTTLLCCVITTFFYFLFYKVACKFNINDSEDDYESAGSPVALTFEYGLVNDFLTEWCEMKTKLNNGEISPNEYFEWKITWPHVTE